MKLFKRYICVKQHDAADCAAACLATVARTHGLKIASAMIRQFAGTNARGTTVLGVVEAAQKLGFTAKAVRAPKDSLEKISGPAIFHVIEGPLSHFVVVHGVVKGEVIVADPAVGVTKIAKQKFLEKWTGIAILLVPAANFQPGEYTRSPWQRFLTLLQPHDFLLAECFMVSLFLMGLGLGFSFYLQLLTDHIVKDHDWTMLRWASLALLVLIVCKALLGQFRGVLLAYVSRKIDVSLMMQYYRHVLRLPMQFFDSRHTGEIMSRLADAVKIREALSGSTLILLVDSSTMFALLGLLFFYSIKLALVATVTLPVLAFLTLKMNVPLRRYQRRTMEHAASLQSHLVENFGGISAIKAANSEENSTAQAETLIVKMLNAFFRTSLWGISSATATELVLGLGMLASLWMAGAMLIRGELSVGQVVAFYSILLFMFQPMLRLVTVNQAVQDAMVAASRLCEIFDLVPETSVHDRKLPLPGTLEGEISFRNVTFAYSGRTPVLQSIDLTLRPRTTTLILDASGSGKSTLAKLLMRYYDASEGAIEIDGINVQDAELPSLRHAIGYVDQDSTVFSGTIEENLLLGDHSISAERIVAAVRAVGLEEFIHSLPHRYQTHIGSRGTALSGGQRQRLAIARALIRDPKILVFDEATSNLDMRSEQEILQLIRKLKKSKTIVVIAHRLSTLAVADQVVVLEKGRIVEQKPSDAFALADSPEPEFEGMHAISAAI